MPAHDLRIPANPLLHCPLNRLRSGARPTMPPAAAVRHAVPIPRITTWECDAPSENLARLCGTWCDRTARPQTERTHRSNFRGGRNR